MFALAANAEKCSKLPSSGTSCSDLSTSICKEQNILKCSSSIGGLAYSKPCDSKTGYIIATGVVDGARKNKKCTDVYDLNKNCINQDYVGCVKKTDMSCTTEKDIGICYEYTMDSNGNKIVSAKKKLDGCSIEHGSPQWIGSYTVGKES